MLKTETRKYYVCDFAGCGDTYLLEGNQQQIVAGLAKRGWIIRMDIKTSDVLGHYCSRHSRRAEGRINMQTSDFDPSKDYSGCNSVDRLTYIDGQFTMSEHGPDLSSDKLGSFKITHVPTFGDNTLGLSFVPQWECKDADRKI